MTRRLIGALLTAVTATVLIGTTPASAATATFAGTVSLSNCSGSVVKPAATPDTAPALVMSNGHCLETGFPSAGQVITNQSSTRTFGLLNASGTKVATLRAKKVVYATMTDTDVTLYQLTSTYAQIKSSYGLSPLELSNVHPTAGAAVDVVSGYWKRIYSCNVDAFAYQVREGSWTWKDSIRYTSACQTIGGTSGSPIMSGGKVVGVNNTGNEDGARCTVNNPCEVDSAGNITVHYKIGYGEETYGIPACLTPANEIALTQTGCTLPR